LSAEEPKLPATITVCVGSSCHIRGSRAVLQRFEKIIKTEDLDQELALVGSFCMERCGERMNWKFNDEDLSSSSTEEAEKTLRGKLLEAGKKDDP